jgi:hypothetical protein
MSGGQGMNVLCTNSDIASHFGSLAVIDGMYRLVYLDERFSLQVSANELSLVQDERKLTLRATDCVVFFLFRAPHESVEAATEAVEIVERLQLFRDACEVIGVTQINPLRNWERAYLKTSLLRLAKNFPGLIPNLHIVDGRDADSLRLSALDRIVKSGYGIRREIGGLMPQATLLPSGKEFIASKFYRYVVQDYINPEIEVRAYATRPAGGTSVTLVKMPIGSTEHPDWRGTVPANELRCELIDDAALKRLCGRICTALELDYVCLDFIGRTGTFDLVDINPHGSWNWLPENARSAVNDHLVGWLAAVAEEA